MKPLLIKFLLSAFTFGCIEASNSHNLSQLECGAGFQEGQHYIKVLSPNSEDLSSKELEIIDPASGRRLEDKQMTEHACLMASKKDLIIRNRLNPWAIRLESGDPPKKLLMKITEESGLQLRCPEPPTVNGGFTTQDLLNTDNLNRDDNILLHYKTISPNSNSSSLTLTLDQSHSKRLVDQYEHPQQLIIEVKAHDLLLGTVKKNSCTIQLDTQIPIPQITYEQGELVNFRGAKFHKINQAESLTIVDGSVKGIDDIKSIEFCAETFLTADQLKLAQDKAMADPTCEQDKIQKTSAFNPQFALRKEGYWLIRYRAIDQAKNISSWQKPYSLLFEQSIQFERLSKFRDQHRINGSLVSHKGPLQLIQDTVFAFNILDNELPTDFEKERAKQILLEASLHIYSKMPEYVELHNEKVSPCIGKLNLSPDGGTLISQTGDGFLLRWDVRTGLPLGEPVSIFGSNRSVIEPEWMCSSLPKAAISPDNRLIAFRISGKFALWDLNRFHAITPAHPWKDIEGHQISFLPDSKTLISLGPFRDTVEILSLESQELTPISLGIHEENLSIIYPHLIDPDTLMIVHNDGRIFYWNTKTHKLFEDSQKLPGSGTFGMIQSVLIRSSKKTALISSKDRTWEFPLPGNEDPLRTFKQFVTLDQHATNSSETMLAGVNENNKIELRRLHNESLVGPTLNQPHLDVEEILFDNNAETMFLRGDRNQLSFWKKPPQLGNTVNNDLKFYHPLDYTEMVVSKKGDRLYTSNTLGQIYKWNPQTRELLETIEIPGCKSIVKGLAISPDGRKLAFGCYQIGKVWVADISGKVNFEVLLEGFQSDVHALAFMDDQTLLVGGDNLEIWKIVPEKRFKRKIDEFKAMKFALFENGSKIVGHNRADIALWDLSNPLKGASSFKGIAKDAHAVAIGERHGLFALGKVSAPGREGHIYLYSIESGKSEGIIEGHQDAISDLLFLDNGLLVSASYDSTIKVWNVKNRLELFKFDKHSDYVTDLYPDPIDPLGFYSASWDGTVRRWSLDAREILNQICQRIVPYLNRDLEFMEVAKETCE
ncbi:WD40 repeat domain-containing protein [Pseudobacteriovorax antillogorgiicola]|uniref:WD40 repeat n=1 Tax=Pseudobacteriovorax antillogorgiicola TaxID=1513793 RepID=A0A1Y6BSI8_9BACT|nr:WD40 repeat domain-containing protein [Pseudobacteriovorax antillogorgiicola]TCS53006.1 WD40 repeat protein [Pseudobacteriovorax antillogorgiicola]SMF27035.1 WD40 repeat [Pseudobacteriovorax antillogorgiicola]